MSVVGDGSITGTAGASIESPLRFVWAFLFTSQIIILSSLQLCQRHLLAVTGLFMNI